MPKKTGMNSAVMTPRNCALDMVGQDRRFADQHAGDEGAEHGVDADQVGDQRHDAHDHQDHGDRRHIRSRRCRWPSGSP